MNQIHKLPALFLLVFTISCNNSIDYPEITITELKEHIDYLASDELQGRLPGTDSDLSSAEYIRDLLNSWGLKPAIEDGLQRFEIVTSLKTGDNSLVINDKNISADMFMPFAFSDNSEHEGSVVFAGYGFDIDNESISWNDYKDIDVSEKWVLMLRADPDIDNPTSLYTAFGADRDKAMTARDKGAAGILMVSGAGFDHNDEFESLIKGEYSVGIPVFRIKREIADIILKDTDNTIDALEKELILNKKPLSFQLDCNIKAVSELIEQKATTHNILMILPGTDPVLKNEYVVIGGHYDHLGLGGKGTSSRLIDSTGVHYGADDNASGIASMLELAEKFAASANNSRSILFAGFAAEEIGLLGSKYLVGHLPVDSSCINAMINLDMIGRLKKSKVLQIGGIGTAVEFEDIIKANTDTSIFMLALSKEGHGPSDHSSFYAKDIPVLFISTGAHLDYHTPNDTPDKINYEGLVSVSNLVFRIASELVNDTARLVFKEAGPKAQGSKGIRKKGVTLGIMPDFAGSVKNGMRADFITPGRPAALGGMKKGDIITGINGMKVNNIQDYMFRLSKLKHGENVNVEILRDGKKELLIISL